MSVDLDINAMSDEDARQLRAKLSLMLQNRGVRQGTGPTADEDSIFLILKRVSNRDRNWPLSAFLEKFGKERYTIAVEALNDFLRQAAGGNVREPIRTKLLSAALEYLAEDMRRWRTKDGAPIPVTPASLLNHIGHLRDAVEDRFPGYIAAGLLGRIAMPAAA